MPFKAKATCRRHIPKQQHRVTNWAAYDAALRQTEGLIGSIMRLLDLDGPLAASVRKFTVGARSATLRSGGDAGSRQRRLCRERPAGMPDRAFSFTTTPQQPVDG